MRAAVNFEEKNLKKRILVIEEEEAIRNLFSIMLSKMAYVVSLAENGRHGLNYFEKNAYDLVICDLTMDDTDGWTIARHIKEKSPHTPVILMTGWGKEEILPQMPQSRADFVMFKPMGFQEVKHTVEKFL
jgi:DNA-binding NtrC family response regulator